MGVDHEFDNESGHRKMGIYTLTTRYCLIKSLNVCDELRIGGGMFVLYDLERIILVVRHVRRTSIRPVGICTHNYTFARLESKRIARTKDIDTYAYM